MANKKYLSILFQYVSDDGDPTEIIPYFEERIIESAKNLHQKGWGLDVRYGTADRNIMDQVEEG